MKLKSLRNGAMLAAPALALLAAPAFAQNDATLRILSPRAGDALGAMPFKIDVSFAAAKKTAVNAVELWCDGVRWVRRDLDTPQQKNVLTFDVDASALSAGNHKFVVKVYTTGGGVVSAPITIQAGNNSGLGEIGGDLKMSFAAPTNGKKVMGNVELSLDVKTASGANPYVTFYVDKQFKTLKNYPPYSYVWDTTTADNGFHTVEAMAYTENANNSVSKKIKLFVDNPGGNTVRPNTLPDLSQPGVITNADLMSPMSAATLSMPLPKRVPAARPIVRRAPAQFSPSAPTGAGNIGAMGLRGMSANGITNSATVSTVTPADTGIRTVIARQAARVTPAISIPRTVIARLTAPIAKKNTLFVTPKAEVVKPVASVKPVIVAPRMATMRVTLPAMVVRPAQTSVDVKPLQIAFDGERIAFDVAPRVEAGMPIAPFRQIFEHTGGRLDWANDAKVVRAVNADREVIIGIGKDSARVNGANIKMDRSAFIERGRTIVPLSFVGQALDVTINFDEKTGRLQITSKK